MAYEQASSSCLLRDNVSTDGVSLHAAEGGTDTVTVAGAGKEEGETINDLCQDACLICLGDIEDRCVLPACRHSLFCFRCILSWINIHRRCPLCNTAIGTHLIHSIRNDSDYVRHRLPQLCGVAENPSSAEHDRSTDPLYVRAEAARQNTFRRAESRRVDNRHSTSSSKESSDYRQEAIRRWERQISVRRRVYRQGLFCQHIGSNRRSRLAAPPTPLTIARTPSMQRQLLQFVRRELIAFPASNLDMDFVATYAIHVFSSFDVKSDEAVALLSDFFTRSGAQHFCHEVYSFARFIAEGAGSYPDKISAFDEWAHYRWPEERISAEAAQRRQLEACNDRMEEASTSGTVDSTSTYDEDAHQSIRAEVIGRRAHLLARLERERGERLLDDDDDDEEEEADKSTNNLLVERERDLKLKVLQKRRTRLDVGESLEA